MRYRRFPRIVALFVLLIGPVATGFSETGAFESQWRLLKAKLKNQDLYRLLWGLPKGGDLHNHHEYSVPMSFWLDRAAKGNYDTRYRISPCGEADPLQWLNLREDSVSQLKECERSDFMPVRSLNESQRRARMSAMTLDGKEPSKRDSGAPQYR